jgi:predicted glycogen debranching enzyme
MQQIAISGPEAQDPVRSSQYEWLLTNGKGGFAAGTVAGLPTRRYHGLLVAAQRPEERQMLLTGLQEELLIEEEHWHLGATRYPDLWHPQGYRNIHRFTLYPTPRWTYANDTWMLTKTVTMIRGSNTVVIGYRLLKAPAKATLLLRPMVAMRSYHGVQKEGQVAYEVEPTNAMCRVIGPSDFPELLLGVSGASACSFASRAAWYRRIQYAIERLRGLEYEEDWFSPGLFHVQLHVGQEVWFWASADGVIMPDQQIVQANQQSSRRIPELLKKAGQPTGAAACLVVAADAYIIERNDATSVIAGYPWFTDWGRDAMISLPGLFLATGRASEAVGVLATFANASKDGLIPNRFPDESVTPEYNTVDASLWFIYAWWKYGQYTGDWQFCAQLWPTVRSIIDGYRLGTQFNIHVNERGLVCAAAEGFQLTWMDAKVGDWVVTPRRGYPVEVNALWYNALCCAAQVGRNIDPQFADRCVEWAKQTRLSFVATFWLSDAGYLADLINQNGKVDTSLRPNQLLALSLPFPLLAGEQARQVLYAVWKHLLTPMGLRSLSPTHPDYHPYYQGNQLKRDAAYHQGTVWAWLIGPFITAYRYAYGRNTNTANISRRLLAPLLDHLTSAGLGHISEVFMADTPHKACGCFAQAWSVAELLRLWAEEFQGEPLELPDAIMG